MKVQWSLTGGALAYDGRLPTLTTGDLRNATPSGALPTRGDRLMLPVLGFPSPIPFKCVGLTTSIDSRFGPVMRIELEIA